MMTALSSRSRQWAIHGRIPSPSIPRRPRIINSVQPQKSNFLFFDGDMIMGYGWAKAPTDVTVGGIVGSDLMKFTGSMASGAEWWLA